MMCSSLANLSASDSSTRAAASASCCASFSRFSLDFFLERLPLAAFLASLGLGLGLLPLLLGLLYSASSRRAGPRPCPWRRLGYHLLWFPCCRLHRACAPRPIPPSSLVSRPSRTWLREMQRWRQAAAKCSDARRRRAYVQFSCVERRATIESAVLDHYLLAMAIQCGGLMTRHFFFAH